MIESVCVAMSNVFDAVDLRRTARAESIFATFPKNRAVFDVVQGAPAPTSAQIKSPTKPYAAERPVPHPNKLHPVYLLWGLCVSCLSLPFILGTILSDNEDVHLFPYRCNLFFLSLVVGLPGASVHLFCCGLCLFSRNKAALVASIMSVFMQILTVEVACGVDNKINVPFYLLVCSIFAGVASQILIIEAITDAKIRQKNSLAVAFFSMLLVMATVSFLTALVSDIFKVKMRPEKKLYLQSIPMVLSFIAYLMSTFMTLRPVFVVIETLSGASL